jgi:hypothetical protein
MTFGEVVKAVGMSLLFFLFNVFFEICWVLPPSQHTLISVVITSYIMGRREYYFVIICMYEALILLLQLPVNAF